MTQPIQQLRIIAEPKAFYRERYGSEIDKSENVAKRYIRAEDKNQFKLEYPTIEISGEWYDAIDRPYVRVASVTVPNESVSMACVHPYPLDTDDSSVVKDRSNNAIYFPITNGDFMSGRKSFLLTRRKLLQKELRSHSPFRVIDSNQRHIPCIANKQRSKQLIKLYQLWKSQLVFSLAKRVDDNVFNVFPGTSVLSQVMMDEMNQKRHEVTAAAASVVTTDDQDVKFVTCAPEKGNWAGGDNVLMVLTKLDRKKALHIYFDYVELNQKKNIRYEFVDMKTIAFQTPACLMVPNDQNRTVSIVAMQDETIIAKFNFLYLAPSILSTTNVCSSCHSIEFYGNPFLSGRATVSMKVLGT
ncbi:unnamed protein product [Rotaria sordida]|uniref:Uncharacterized protein n=1 Tax=Rotaria sordida TaxID=392033 RepID=A0A815AT87_9BILA|nr:unnamed protein product [Rotaria sordida]CAF1261627.1 unnamed protein product [Rotaria sordida]